MSARVLVGVVLGLMSLTSLVFAPTAAAQHWAALGPNGGDVRSLAADPKDPSVLYLGTVDGHIFASSNAGETWKLQGRIGDRSDTVVFSLMADRRDSDVIFATTWTLAPGGGGVYRSDNRGQTWKPAGLAGQTVRAIAQAPSRLNLLVAGTLDGVYRSQDDGKNWERLTPVKHPDLLNFDSVAIDPNNPDIIYAGTYHLAWKTIDGGRTWQPIHKGMIDDSDVMNIEVDSTDPQRIYATACSGIYRSGNQGELWAKIQGIPPTSRRTHLIRQDPKRPQVFYAGTTQGLWKSTDGTMTWKRVSPANWSIGALVINAKNSDRLVIGLERQGIVVSEDAGSTFRASNQGFVHQQVMDFAVDPARRGRMLVVLTNSVEPVQLSHDNGKTWLPAGQGLKPEALLRVYGTPAGWWASLSSGGLMRLDETKMTWVRAGNVLVETKAAPAKPPAKTAQKAPAKTPAKAPATRATATQAKLLAARVNALAFADKLWLAATTDGMLVSRDNGANWSEFRIDGQLKQAYAAVQVSRDAQQIAALNKHQLLLSSDAGKTWTRHEHSFGASNALRLFRADEQRFLIAGNAGLYVSRDAGATWQQAPVPDLTILDVAVSGQWMLASTLKRGLHFSADRGASWKPLDAPHALTRFPVVLADAEAHFLMASSHEGLHAVRFTSLTAQQAGPSGTATTAKKE